MGVATAMIAVASLALPGLLPRDRDSQLGADTPTNSSAPPTVSVDKKAQQIGDQLARRIEQQVPDFKDIGASFHSGGRTYPPYPTSNAPKRPDEPEFSGFVYFTDLLGPTAMEVVAGEEPADRDDLLPERRAVPRGAAAGRIGRDGDRARRGP